MKQLLEWDIARISETTGAFNRQVAHAAANLGFFAVAEPLRAPHYLALRRKAVIQKELTEIFAREKVFVSIRGRSIRVTPHVYNTVEDGERLIACLRRVAGT
jgi:selenocysteine lyase/cysteine desulfurase